MKSKRQEKILELIEKYNIETQEELIARLAECGIESKQTTVSRDIKELYLYKEPIGGGRSRYAVSGKADHIDNTKRLKLILNECSVGVDYAGIVVLLKTLPGLADAAGAAIDAMKREFNNAKWTLAAVGYQCAFAYTIALIVYQLGLLFSGAGFTVATAIAILLLAGLVYLVVRKNPYNDNHLTQKVSA